MKTYIVRGSRGYFDDYTWFIIAVCNSPEIARDIKDKWLAKLGMMKQKYTKEQCKIFEEESEEDPSLWSNELNEWVDWKYKMKYDEYDDNVFIDEVNLNEIIHKL